jgi:hypothetical protein
MPGGGEVTAWTCRRPVFSSSPLERGGPEATNVLLSWIPAFAEMTIQYYS